MPFTKKIYKQNEKFKPGCTLVALTQNDPAGLTAINTSYSDYVNVMSANA